MIVTRGRQRGLEGVTLEWVLWGDGPGPQRGLKDAQKHTEEPHGQPASRIAAALQADLSHNEDRKSTRLNSSHEWSSYAVFCLKKKRTQGSAAPLAPC